VWHKIKTLKTQASASKVITRYTGILNCWW